MFFGLLIGTVLALAVLILVGILLMDTFAQNNMFATTVESENIKAIAKSGELVRFIAKCPGFKLDQNHNLLDLNRLTGNEIFPEPKERFKFIKKWWGIHWVSLWWPMVKVHEFEVVADSFLTQEEITALARNRGIAVKDLEPQDLVKFEIRKVDHLRSNFTHPTVVRGVELAGDGWKVNFAFKIAVRAFNPFIVIFRYKGKVMNEVDAGVSNAVISFCAEPTMNYELLRQEMGTKPDATVPLDNRLARKILDLNGSVTPNNRSDDGLRERFGVEICAVFLVAYDLDKDSKRQLEASMAVQTVKLEAEAAIEEAKGQATVKEIGAVAERKREVEVGIGKAQAAKALRDVQIEGLPKGAQERIIREELRAKAITETNVASLVLNYGDKETPTAVILGPNGQPIRPEGE